MSPGQRGCCALGEGRRLVSLVPPLSGAGLVLLPLQTEAAVPLTAWRSATGVRRFAANTKVCSFSTFGKCS